MRNRKRWPGARSWPCTSAGMASSCAGESRHADAQAGRISPARDARRRGLYPPGRARRRPRLRDALTPTALSTAFRPRTGDRGVRKATWDRGDGQPAGRASTTGAERVLEHLCSGRGSSCSDPRGPRRAERDPATSTCSPCWPTAIPAAARRTCFEICEAIGYEPRADVVVAFEREVREAARSLASVLGRRPRRACRSAAATAAHGRGGISMGQSPRLKADDVDALRERVSEAQYLAAGVRTRDQVVAAARTGTRPSRARTSSSRRSASGTSAPSSPRPTSRAPRRWRCWDPSSATTCSARA